MEWSGVEWSPYLETVVVGAARIATIEHEFGIDAELLMALLDTRAVLLLRPIVAIDPVVLSDLLLLVKEQECTA